MSDMKPKNILEVVLMPLVIALLGILGTFVITNVQQEYTKGLADAEIQRADRLAEAERLRAEKEFAMTMQVKLLEIFGERMVTGDLQERKNALLLLRAVDPNFAEPLTHALLQTSSTEPELRALAESELKRRIELKVVTEPPAVAPGQKAEIEVIAMDGGGNRLSDATITVSSGGGRFLRDGEQYDPNSRLHSPYSVTGKTDNTGKFKTQWVCNPCAAGYGMTAGAQKDDLVTGKKEFTISIKQ